MADTAVEHAVYVHVHTEKPDGDEIRVVLVTICVKSSHRSMQMVFTYAPELCVHESYGEGRRQRITACM